MAYTTINKPSSYFNTVLYTGNGSTQSVTGVNFQPDFLWIKQRDTIRSHQLMDAVRGASVRLLSDQTAAESASALTSFDSDGFTVDGSSLNGTNASGGTYVGWNWLANGAGSSNTDGSITSTVSANTTSGFSIVTYAGNSTAGATIGHGLNAVPSMVIVKSTSNAESWSVYHKSVTTANNYYLYLNSTGALVTSGGDRWSVSSNSLTLFGLGNDGTTNSSGQNYVAYCFAEKKGFSKFGSYTGNGSSDGTFVYLGFKPAFVIIKNISTGGTHWRLADSARYPNNLTNTIELYPSTSAAESTNEPTFDFLSNGFKLRGDTVYKNSSGDTYIYMAFAEHPLVSSTGTPCTAR